MQHISFLVLSDTHNDAFPSTDSLPAADVVIHCGDLTQIGGLSNYRQAIESLASCRAELKLVIPGNHDVSLDDAWWAKNLDSDDEDDEPDRARAIFADNKYTSRGVRLLNEGTHDITLGDGRSFRLYTSQWTPAFNNYAFGYPRDDGNNRFDDLDMPGSSRIPDGVDVVVTHGPPRPEEGKTAADYRLDLSGTGEHLGCDKLWKAIGRVRPKLHCFGHIHEGHGAQTATFAEGEDAVIEDAEIVEVDGALSTGANGNSTLLVNAAMQRHGETTHNTPWIVEMSL